MMRLTTIAAAAALSGSAGASNPEVRFAGNRLVAASHVTADYKTGDNRALGLLARSRRF